MNEESALWLEVSDLLLVDEENATPTRSGDLFCCASKGSACAPVSAPSSMSASAANIFARSGGSVGGSSVALVEGSSDVDAALRAALAGESVRSGVKRRPVSCLERFPQVSPIWSRSRACSGENATDRARVRSELSRELERSI